MSIVEIVSPLQQIDEWQPINFTVYGQNKTVSISDEYEIKFENGEVSLRYKSSGTPAKPWKTNSGKWVYKFRKLEIGCDQFKSEVDWVIDTQLQFSGLLRDHMMRVARQKN